MGQSKKQTMEDRLQEIEEREKKRKGQFPISEEQVPDDLDDVLKILNLQDLNEKKHA